MYFITYNIKTSTILKINNQSFLLNIPTFYTFISDNKDTIDSDNIYNITSSESLFNQNILSENENFTTDYNIVYSFDKNYFSGAFASIYSLLQNFDSSQLSHLIIHIFVPENNFEELQELLLRHILSKYNVVFKFILINKLIIPQLLLETKCFKGGNHLLNISNYCRLIAPYLLYDVSHFLYIDSDTIIQNDISKKMNEIIPILKENSTITIYGNKSFLNYKNILNCNNLSHFIESFGEDFDLSRNVIYTGTLLFVPCRMKNLFSNILKLVELHNSIIHKGGLYKLFTMSIINIAFADNISNFPDSFKIICDLGYNTTLDIEELTKTDILDWSGIFKPWYDNGLYRDLWKKYDLLNISYGIMLKNKNTIETFIV